MTERTKRRRTNIQTRSTAANATIHMEFTSSSSSASSTRVPAVLLEHIDQGSVTGTAHSSTRSEQASVPETSSLGDSRGGTDSSSTSQQPVSLDQAASDDVTSWIHENYEWKIDSNVPRSGIFEHYRHYCSSRKIKPVNAATFGKLIRAAFPDITTRRLGNRGQSKYQYCNIQRKEFQLDDTSTQLSNPLESHFNGTTVATTPLPIEQIESNTDNRRLLSDTSGFPSFRLPLPIAPLATSSNDLFSDIYVPPLTSRPPSSEFSTATRSSSSLSSVLMDRPNRQENQEMNDSTTLFAIHYNNHCRLLHTAIRAGEFEKVESIYKDFYQNMPDSHRSLLTHHPKLVDSIWHWDCVLYDSLVLDLLPEVDTPISERMMSGIRYFIKVLPNYLNHLLQDYPTKIRQNKVDVAGLFSCKLHRHLTLNQFAITAANILRQPNLLNTMKLDWADLDIAAVLDHVLWVCDCRNEDMQQILSRDITHLLTVGSTLDQWIGWEEKLIDKFVPRSPQINKIQDIDGYLTKAKQFILKWKVYTGLLMQQFYTKKVSSIDSFRSLQFFLDDLVLYHVEERISIMNVNVNKRLGPERHLPSFSPTTNLTLNQTN